MDTVTVPPLERPPPFLENDESPNWGAIFKTMSRSVMRHAQGDRLPLVSLKARLSALKTDGSSVGRVLVKPAICF